MPSIPKLIEAHWFKQYHKYKNNQVKSHILKELKNHVTVLNDIMTEFAYQIKYIVFHFMSIIHY